MPSLPQIFRATLFRFLPSVTFGTVALTALLAPGSLTDMPVSAWIYLGGILIVQSIGFGGTLMYYRRRLEPAARITGFRSALVGALGTALLLVVSYGGQSFLSQAGLWIGATLTGAVSAAVMYWPWLRRGPRELASGESRALNAGEGAQAPIKARTPDRAKNADIAPAI